MNQSASAINQPALDFLNSALIEQARYLMAHYNRAESMAILEQLYATHPSHEAESALAECAFIYAKSEQGVGRLDRAEALLRRVLNLSPLPDGVNDLLSMVRFQQATYLASLELLYQAEAALCEALVLNPSFDKAQQLLAHLSSRPNRAEPEIPLEKLAMEEIQLRRSGTSNDALAGCLAAQVTALLAETPNHTKAESLWRAALKLAPGNRDIIIGLATALFNRAYMPILSFEHAEAEALLWNFFAYLPNFELGKSLLKRCIEERTRHFSSCSNQHHAIARQLAECLRVMDPVEHKFIRVGGVRDGGYVMVDHGLDNSVVYSLGIGGDVSWDLQMAERGNEIYQFDHTIEKLPQEHSRFHWFKQGIGTEAETNSSFRSIRSLITANGHVGRRDLILKIDIEGYEWPILAELDDAILGQFSQIVGEFHSLFDIVDAKQGALIVRVLQKLNTQFQLVHTHANNICPPRFIGGYTFAGNYELTFVRKADHNFTICERRFPTELDYPCIPNWADHYTGRGGGF